MKTKNNIQEAFEKLKKLGADVEQVDGGLKLTGYWDKKFDDYHELFVEINGPFHHDAIVHDKDFLCNLIKLDSLYVSHMQQHKDFLRNLKTLNSLSVKTGTQHKDFLRQITTLEVLNTDQAKQHKDFLPNLIKLGELRTELTVQHKDFLRNITTIGSLYTIWKRQEKGFLSNVTTMGNLYTSLARQDKGFLKNVTTLGFLSTSHTVQEKGFLPNLTVLGLLGTTNDKQEKGFLKNLKFLGQCYSERAVQEKSFLKNVSNVFPLPYLYADGILSMVISTKQVGDVTIHSTNRVGGYSDLEYVATDGEYYAHAKSIKMAILDLNFKKAGRDTGWLEDKTTDSVLSFADMVTAYRAITGACSGGVEGFLEGIETKESYTIAEVIDITAHQYGNIEFANFFKK